MPRSRSGAWTLLASMGPAVLMALAVFILLLFRIGMHRPIIRLLLARYGHAGSALVSDKWQGRYGSTLMVNFQCRPDYAPTIEALVSPEKYDQLRVNDRVGIHFETIWCSWAVVDDGANAAAPSGSGVRRWLNFEGLMALVVGFYFLQFLWSAAKLARSAVKSEPGPGDAGPADEKTAALIEKLDHRLNPDSSRTTVLLCGAGILLGLVGALGFSTTEGGLHPGTIGCLATMIAGVVLLVLGMMAGQKAQRRMRFASLSEPGGSWRIGQNIGGDDEVGSQVDGFQVRVRFQRAQYGKSGEKLSPALTVVRFSLPNDSGMKFALRRDLSLGNMDIKDVWAHLAPIDSVAVDGLKLFGKPSDQVRALFSRWLGQGFAQWSKTLKERTPLKLDSARLDGQSLEFRFEGWLTEPLLDEAPSLKLQLDELLRGCLPWCRAL